MENRFLSQGQLKNMQVHFLNLSSTHLGIKPALSITAGATLIINEINEVI